MHYMTINFAAEQSNKTTGNPFVSVQGSAVVDGRLLDAECLVDGSTEGLAGLTRIAKAYRAAHDAERPADYPRGFALEATAGWLVDWDQAREPYQAGDGTMRPGRWVIKPLRSAEGASLRLVKAPPLKVDIDPEADALLAEYGI